MCDFYFIIWKVINTLDSQYWKIQFVEDKVKLIEENENRYLCPRAQSKSTKIIHVEIFVIHLSTLTNLMCKPQVFYYKNCVVLFYRKPRYTHYCSVWNILLGTLYQTCKIWSNRSAEQRKVNLKKKKRKFLPKFKLNKFRNLQHTHTENIHRKIFFLWESERAERRTGGRKLEEAAKKWWTSEQHQDTERRREEGDQACVCERGVVIELNSVGCFAKFFATTRRVNNNYRHHRKTTRPSAPATTHIISHFRKKIYYKIELISIKLFHQIKRINFALVSRFV